MLLKKTLEYRKHSISFARTKMKERIDPWKLYLGCHGCGFLNKGACILKYEKGIDIRNLMCGFELYIKNNITGNNILYTYAAKESINS